MAKNVNIQLNCKKMFYDESHFFVQGIYSMPGSGRVLTEQLNPTQFNKIVQ